MCCLLASAAYSIDWGLERSAYQLVEDAVVEGHLGLAALEEVVVVVLEAVGVSLELVEAVGVNVLDAVRERCQLASLLPLRQLNRQPDCFPNAHWAKYIHASSAARHLAPLLQALELSAAVALVLALHIVVVECLAAVTNEVRSTGQE